MKITIVGTGYVGLISGVCFASKNHDVICLDNNKKKINLLNKNRMPIYEEHLFEFVTEARQKKKITFTTDKKRLIKIQK